MCVVCNSIVDLYVQKEVGPIQTRYQQEYREWPPRSCSFFVSVQNGAPRVVLSDGAKMPTAHEIQQELIDDTILIMSFERDSMPKRTRFASIGIGRIDGVLKMFLTYLSDTIPNNTLK